MAHYSRQAFTLPALALVLAACEPTPSTGNPDASTPATCDLPSPAVACTGASCTTVTGTKTFGQATLPADKGWLAVAWTSSEVYAANDTRTLYYSLTGPGGLMARSEREKTMDPVLAEMLRHNAARLDFEKALREITVKGPILGDTRGTAIRAVDLLPPGVKKQVAACTAGAPSPCGDTAVCVIPEGMTAGTCSSMLTVKFYGLGPAATDVTAQVVKAGSKGAIIVDTADLAKVSAADATALLTKFDQHIAPRDHQIFGCLLYTSPSPRD